MMEFVECILNKSENYVIKIQESQSNNKKPSFIVIVQNPEIYENPKKLFMFLHEHKLTQDKYKSTVKNLLVGGFYITDIFYKDETDFFNREAHKSQRHTLNQYTHQEKNAIIRLSQIEKIAKNDNKEDILSYYQPKATILDESIRNYKFKHAQPDYSNTPEWKKDFVKQGPLENTVIMEEFMTINPTDNITFKPYKFTGKAYIIKK